MKEKSLKTPLKTDVVRQFLADNDINPYTLKMYAKLLIAECALEQDQWAREAFTPCPSESAPNATNSADEFVNFYIVSGCSAPVLKKDIVARYADFCREKNIIPLNRVHLFRSIRTAFPGVKDGRTGSEKDLRGVGFRA